MTDEPRERNKIDLAASVARGCSISGWARKNNVCKMTACRWAREPEVRALIEAFRRQAIDQAVGVLAGHSGWAANKMCKIAKSAESDSVQLRAVRGILSDLLAVSRYSGLEARLAGLEAQSRQRSGVANVSSPITKLTPDASSACENAAVT
jgi:hypothetical protein